ncbi:MAG: PQQ-like beta-propeller repeat protein [Deltaproteobacteria bacterium]|nr:PQQ-like beta-propeller repeat protein [Deltaproteobacteria bacterium]
MATQQRSAVKRFWPALAILAFLWLSAFGIGLVAPATIPQFIGMTIGPPLALLLLFVWWLRTSQDPWPGRLLPVGLALAGLGLASIVGHKTIPMVIFLYGISLLSVAFVGWAFFTRHWLVKPRRWALVAAVLAACAPWTLMRSDGVDGEMHFELTSRWSPTAEERLLSDSTAGSRQGSAAGLGNSDEQLELNSPWPGFRGAQRDGVVPGLRLATDWQVSPPQELWKRPIGPGWSSFSLANGLLFTQEQRGEEEIVSAYRAATGDLVWAHSDAARFWEAMAGAGPRATPTLYDGKVYSFGATGILNALNASDGALLWSRNAAEDANAPTPDWGFSSSPLVVDGLVLVHTGGPDGKAVAAYSAATGEPRWFAPAGPLSYSSFHLTTLGGVRQLLILTGDGIRGLSPTDGAVLWQHQWPVAGGARVVQPAVTADGGVLLGTGFGMGMRRLQVARTSADWQVTESWTSKGLKPYYNDFVVHHGSVYGFDGSILSCIDLATGERQWKGGRYGNGQMLLLPDQDLLLVLSERGFVALVEAVPSGFSEVARMEAIEGKTWNHPVIAEGVLYLRNGEEMAAYRLPLAAERTTKTTG